MQVRCSFVKRTLRCLKHRKIIRGKQRKRKKWKHAFYFMFREVKKIDCITNWKREPEILTVREIRLRKKLIESSREHVRYRPNLILRKTSLPYTLIGAYLAIYFCLLYFLNVILRHNGLTLRIIIHINWHNYFVGSNILLLLPYQYDQLT